MSVDLVRIDNRLVHGQVIEAWVPYIRATRIVVIDDEVADDPLKRSIVELAMPRELPLDVLHIREAPLLLSDAKYQNARVIVLFTGPREALAAYEAGFHFSALNVGNMHYAQGKARMSPSVCCTREELEILRGFARNGVAVEIRAVPKEAARRIEAGPETFVPRS